MKNLKTKLIQWLDRLDACWRVLPVKKQRRYTMMLFLGYALLSVAMLLKAWYEPGSGHHELRIEHIENPTLEHQLSTGAGQDSSSLIFKNQLYEK